MRPLFQLRPRVAMRFMALLALPLVAGGYAAAGARYDEVPESAPHATIEFAKAEGLLELRASPLELNGARPKYGKWRRFRIPVGTFRLLVGERSRANCWTCPEPRYTCELEFEAEAGVAYTVSLTEESDGFSYQAIGPTGSPVAACRSTGPDAIDSLVERLWGSAEWADGKPADLYPRVDLPTTASAEQLVARLFQQQVHYLDGAETFRILGSRTVFVLKPSEPYLAVLVDTNLGQRVVMFRYDEARAGWWRSGLYLAK